MKQILKHLFLHLIEKNIKNHLKKIKKVLENINVLFIMIIF